MIKTKRLAMVGGTVICALGIGFIMQSGQPAPQPARSLAPVPIEKSDLTAPTPEGDASAVVVNPDEQAALIPVDAPDAGTELNLELVTLTAAVPLVNAPRALPSLEQRVVVRGRDLDLPTAPADPEIPQLGCAVTATATPGAAATAILTVNAPCYGNERVTVHHTGMMFTQATDATGQLTVTVPVLAEQAVFILAFANGNGAVAQTYVPDLAAYDRIVLQWTGREGFQIHAREFGADYGEAGHVWAEGGQSADLTALGEGGYVTRLGDVDTLVPQMAEVYTFPTDMSNRAGTVAMSIEAEVTNSNCGRAVEAQTLELKAGGTLRTRDLTLEVPNCTAVGDFLVLNNLVDDLKIAGN